LGGGPRAAAAPLAEHRAGDRLLVRRTPLQRGHGPPAAQHRHGVGDRDRLAELVGDQHRAAPGLGERPQPAQQLVDLRRREHGGRLVEDQDPHVAGERFDDLHALLHRHGELADAGGRVEHETGRPPDLDDTPRGLPGVVAPGPAERDVLRDGHRRYEGEVLMHHPHPRGHRLRRAVEGARRSADAHGPGVGAQHPERDAGERGLPCPVLAEQRVHRTRRDDERGAGQRVDAAEPLVDPGQGERRLTVRSRVGPRCPGHRPVGASTKSQGTPNRSDTSSATARTPNVSVA
jgi:hypothetical protein